jgi:hypothetical protein
MRTHKELDDYAMSDTRPVVRIETSGHESSHPPMRPERRLDARRRRCHV